MSIRIDYDLSDWRPLDQEGNYTEGALGTHRGHMACYNVKNAQPGFHYYVGGTSRSQLRRQELQGWQPVSLQDPERLCEESMPDWKAAGVDTSITRNDTVLCRMPEERYREYRAQIDRRSEEMRRDDSATEFLEKGNNLRAAYGRDIYFKGPGHGFSGT